MPTELYLAALTNWFRNNQIANYDDAIQGADRHLLGAAITENNLVPARHVFSQLNASIAAGDIYISPKKLSIDALPTYVSNATASAQLGGHLKEYKGTVNQLLAAAPEAVENLLTLQKTYLWCVEAPANKAGVYNGNLHEYLKLRAALAACFSENKAGYLLACVDLSGIQKFIYDISSRKAALSLKGRSFYLQLLIDTIGERLLADLKLPSCHVVYSSGGKTFLVLPDKEEVKKVFCKLEKTVQENLFQEHGLSLYACFGYVAVLADANYRDAGIWQKLSQVTSQKKSLKLHNYLSKQQNFDKLFTPQDGGKPDLSNVCAVTGVVGNTNQLDDGTRVSRAVYDQINLGKALKNGSTILVFGYDPSRELNYDRQNTNLSMVILQPINLGVWYVITDSQAAAQIQGHQGTIYLNGVEAAARSITNNATQVYKFRFYGGNEQPMADQYRPKTFEDLGEGEGNFKRIGVLRMDVDGLGEAFIKGVAGSKSLITYATLSNSLDWYFSGYLNHLRNSTGYYASVNILYSGGDDLFVVGTWESSLLFAWEVRDNFKDYVAGAKPSISGGLVLVNPKYPIAKAAEYSGEAESLAKLHDGGAKDAMVIFGEAIKWSEFESIERLKDDFFSLLTDNRHKLPRRMLHSIQELYLKMNASELQGTSVNRTYIWTTVYNLARYLKDNKIEDPQNPHYQFVENVKQETVQHSTPLIKRRAIASRWAELKTRN